MRLRGTWTLKSPNHLWPDINVRSLQNLKNFPKITLSTQNCNSLNVSTVCDKQLKKISAICALETDIILLCDFRLNSAKKEIEKIEKLFLYNKSKQYDFYYNSSKNSRGVGILVSHHLNYSISKTLKDDSENILGLCIRIDEFPLRIFSVYGPNDNCRDFFDRLTNFLDEDPSTPVILGGDWNATLSCSDIPNNIDTFRMTTPPSLTRSLWINQICRNHYLSDPFRALHPSLQDFTLAPHGERRNRSRIDFFLIGDELLQILSKLDHARARHYPFRS